MIDINVMIINIIKIIIMIDINLWNLILQSHILLFEYEIINKIMVLVCMESWITCYLLW